MARMMPRGKGRMTPQVKERGSLLHAHDELVRGKEDDTGLPLNICAGGRPRSSEQA